MLFFLQLARGGWLHAVAWHFLWMGKLERELPFWVWLHCRFGTPWVWVHCDAAGLFFAAFIPQ